MTTALAEGKGADVQEVDRQAQRREIEAQTRQSAVAYAELVVETGGTKKEAAEDLGVAERTLRSWSDCTIEPRGRPRTEITEEQTVNVGTSIEKIGPLGGVATLKRLHPEVTRRELSRLVVENRRRYIVEHGLTTEELCWSVPGVVWTMDHTKLAVPTEDGRQYALSVRDLGSGYQLLWQAVESADAASTVRLLTDLFLQHGPPLVLKSDNGPAFIAHETEALLASWQVRHLLSPPWTPGYNGTVEVAMYWLKARTEYAAWRAGRREALRPEDFAHACMIANELSWSARCRGARPIDAWQARPALAEDFRHAFGEAVATCERALRERIEGAPGKRALAQARRNALRRALVAHGFLFVRRRPITLHELSRKAANIR